MNDQHVDAAAAYVLDALPPDEREEFEAHLATCEACRQEVAGLRPVVDVLPLAADVVQPPGNLRARVMAAIEDDESQPPALTSLPGGAPRPRRDRWKIGMGLLAAAAIVVIAALGIWNARLQQRANSNATAAAVIKAESQSGSRVALMSGTGALAGTSARVVAPSSGSTAYLVVHKLPPAPKGKVYQLWVMHSPTNVPRSAGIYSPNGSDLQIWTVPRPTALYHYTAFTVEPGPHGSRLPTTKPIMIGRFSA